MSQILEPFVDEFDQDEIEIIFNESYELALSDRKKKDEYFASIKSERVFKPHSFDVIKKMFVSAYKQREARQFIWTKWNTEVVKQLCYYFSNDERFNGDLEKGILLQGNVGTGKTSVLKAFQLIGSKGFGTITCKELENLYDRDGSEVVSKYSELKTDLYLRVNGWLFDDLGWESKGKHYGKEKNVMEDILEAVNSKRTWGHIFITTNDSIDTIKEKYGDRVHSRLKMMFNQITYDSSAPDIRGKSKEQIEQLEK